MQQTRDLTQHSSYEAFVSISIQAINVAGQTQDSNTQHAAINPPAPKERALIPAGMDKHAKKALWEQRKGDRARARQVLHVCQLAGLRMLQRHVNAAQNVSCCT